jgi:hypothetical protein
VMRCSSSYAGNTESESTVSATWGIKRRLLHGFSRNRLLIDQPCSWPWHIDDREAVNARE